ncbi:hypothetical protein KORDIASMS9_00206 [Kordia sp. SMS9]|uniref:hypothetical protein n=1 Tax=Kordia sp. SMS9 TaxID=2282170 RepID=UPI000E0DDF3F|nr:hypothetical protein [Kordia sp. SMS9]AXG68022.1 hypothetical protein KORDIASMS9_00206 [Kordia sp. SMS9]
MKKLSLKKIQIAAIGNAAQLKGGSNNSNADTICNTTGDDSVTSCDNCGDNSITSSNATTTRANGSGKTAGLDCIN